MFLAILNSNHRRRRQSRVSSRATGTYERVQVLTSPRLRPSDVPDASYELRQFVAEHASPLFPHILIYHTLHDSASKRVLLARPIDL